MLRYHGFTSIPHRVTSADASHLLGWYLESHSEDRYDEETNYQITLFEVASEQPVSSLMRGVHIKNDMGEVTGKGVLSVDFLEKSNDTIVITYDDHSKEVVKLVADMEILASVRLRSWRRREPEQRVRSLPNEIRSVPSIWQNSPVFAATHRQPRLHPIGNRRCARTCVLHRRKV